MEKTNNTIIRWTKIATVLFIAMVMVMDAVALIVAKYISYVWALKTDSMSVGIIAGSIYAGTIAGYVILVSVYKLLSNMEKDEVFEKKNTKLMSAMVWGLIGAGVCSFLVWPGIGQVINDEKREKVLTHAVIGLVPLFRFWSAYDAFVDRKGGVWENRI